MMNNVQEQVESIGRHNFNLYYKDKYPNASEQQVNDFLDAYTDL